MERLNQNVRFKHVVKFHVYKNFDKMAFYLKFKEAFCERLYKSHIHM